MINPSYYFYRYPQPTACTPKKKTENYEAWELCDIREEAKDMTLKETLEKHSLNELY